MTASSPRRKAPAIIPNAPTSGWRKQSSSPVVSEAADTVRYVAWGELVMTVANAQPTVMAREGLNLPTPYEVPQGELETAVVQIFADVFGIDQVGVNDDFFDIGGDSIVAETISM